MNHCRGRGQGPSGKLRVVVRIPPTSDEKADRCAPAECARWFSTVRFGARRNRRRCASPMCPLRRLTAGRYSPASGGRTFARWCRLPRRLVFGPPWTRSHSSGRTVRSRGSARAKQYEARARSEWHVPETVPQRARRRDEQTDGEREPSAENEGQQDGVGVPCRKERDAGGDDRRKKHRAEAGRSQRAGPRPRIPRKAGCRPARGDGEDDGGTGEDEQLDDAVAGLRRRHGPEHERNGEPNAAGRPDVRAMSRWHACSFPRLARRCDVAMRAGVGD